MIKQVAKVLLVDDQNQCLFLLRSDHPTFPNDPDLPGGTVEVDENVKLAAIREVQEETGIDISSLRVTRLYTGEAYSSHGTIYSLYVCKLPNRPDVSISWEHSSYEWMNLDTFIAKAGQAVDTYMHMVHDIVSAKRAYFATWESGRESKLLDDIIAGRKTIEGRLNKGKFAEYQIGDTVSLRRDIRGEDGVLRDGESNAAQVEIMAIRSYANFLELVTAEGFEKVIPGALSAQEAADEYNKYYSAEDQAKYGVLGIEIRPIFNR